MGSPATNRAGGERRRRQLMIVTLALWRALRNLWRSPASKGLLTVTASVILIGAGFYRVVEDLSWVDSFYLAVITLSTVGYGDIVPTTTAGKVFTTVYVLIGVGLLVTFLSEVSRAMVDDLSRPRRRRSGEVDDGLADE